MLLYNKYHSGINLKNSMDDLSEWTEFHIHDEYEMVYLQEGSPAFFIGSNLYHPSPGDLLVLRGSELHILNMNAKPEKKCIFTAIEFNRNISVSVSSCEDMIRDIFESGNHISLIRPSYRNSQLIRAILCAIADLQANPARNALSLTHAYFIRLLYIVCESVEKSPGRITSCSYNPQLSEIIKYIDANLSGDLKLDTICNNFYISKQHVIKLFKDITGGTAHGYIIHKRLANAKKMLSQGFTVYESSYSSGFSSYSNFIRLFKDKTGLSPGKYMKL